jgi:hypothetical protein
MPIGQGPWLIDDMQLFLATKKRDQFMFEKVTIFFVGESYIGSAFSETAACRSVVSLSTTSMEDEEADMTVFRFCLSLV